MGIRKFAVVYIMSQSDYIHRKKIAIELAEQRKLKPVLNSGQYINYKEFSLENTITSTKPNYNNFIPSNVSVIFNMRLSAPRNCPTFTLCRNTNGRPNRVLRSLDPSPHLVSKPKHNDITKLPICSGYC